MQTLAPRRKKPLTPTWVKLTGLVAAALLAAIVVLHLQGRMGQHRHPGGPPGERVP